MRGAEVIIHNAGFDVGFRRRTAPGRPAALRRAGRRHSRHAGDGARDVPGQGQPLDAPCRRLEVDNTHRHFHGALLDSNLLAEVYIRMTRGQNSLVIDEEKGSEEQVEQIDEEQADRPSTFVLPVLRAAEAEQAAHDKMLAELDKASGGKTIWRQVLAHGEKAVA